MCAFATNTRVRALGVANTAVSDALGVCWGRVLGSNATITSLNLESNAISSNGIEVPARGSNAARSLTECRSLTYASPQPQTAPICCSSASNLLLC